MSETNHRGTPHQFAILHPSGEVMCKMCGKLPVLIEYERKVLTVLADATIENPEFNCIYMSSIAEDTKLEKRQVRRALRNLKRKGLTEFVRGIFHEDDGRVAGSAYCATEAGVKVIELLRPDERQGVLL